MYDKAVKTPHLTFPQSCWMNRAKWKHTVILNWLLPPDKKEKPPWAQAVLKGFLKSVRLCMRIAKLLTSLVTPGLCDAQKGFASSSQELLFIPQRSPWDELPKWCFCTEWRKRREVGGVGGKKECERKCKEDMIRGKKKRDREEKETQGDVKSSPLESEFSGRFHETRKRNTIIIYPTAAGSAHKNLHTQDMMI